MVGDFDNFRLDPACLRDSVSLAAGATCAYLRHGKKQEHAHLAGLLQERQERIAAGVL